jgi:hypothetical protein
MRENVADTSTAHTAQKLLLHPLPGASGGVPNVEDFNGILGNAVEYFVPIASNHLHTHIWIICSL